MSSSRVRVYLGCSLDGCIAGPDHDLSFLNETAPDPGPASVGGLGFDDFIAQIGALLMGRRTYQVSLDYDAWFYGDRPVLVATHRPLPPAPQGGIARGNDLQFDPPVMHEGRMVQVTARVLHR